jgi:hypothetical protein
MIRSSSVSHAARKLRDRRSCIDRPAYQRVSTPTLAGRRGEHLTIPMNDERWHRDPQQHARDTICSHMLTENSYARLCVRETAIANLPT